MGLIGSDYWRFNTDVKGDFDVISEATSGYHPTLKIDRQQSDTAAVNDPLGQLEFSGRNDAAEQVNYFRMRGKIKDASDGTEDAQMSFKIMTAGSLTDRIIIESGQPMEFKGGDIDISDGDIVFSTAGKGICLGVTTNTDANTLDDYEEGTHTVTMTCATSGSITMNGSYNTMAYVKIGNLVTVSGDLRVSSVSSPVGAIAMSLPFTVSSSRFVNAILTHGIAKQSNQLGGFILQTNSGAATTAISYNKDNATNASLSGTIAASNEFKVTLTYQV